MERVSTRICLIVLALCLLPMEALPIDTHVRNSGLDIVANPSTALIDGITNRLCGESYKIEEVSPFELTVDGQLRDDFHLESARTDGPMEFVFRSEGIKVEVGFRTDPGCKFIEKTLRIQNTSIRTIRIDRITAWKLKYDSNSIIPHPHRDPSVYQWLINVFLSGRKGGCYFGVENPCTEMSDLRIFDSDTVELSYNPHWIIAPGETFEGDPAFLGVFKKEGVYVFKELGRLSSMLESQVKSGIPTAKMRYDQEVLDWGEVWAMQDFVSAIQPPQDFIHPGYYARVVGPASDVASSKLCVDEIAGVGGIPHIEWNTWIAGSDPGKPAIYVEMKDGLPRFVANPDWKEIAEYAGKRGIYSGAMEAVPNNFYSSRTDWLVIGKDGKPWDNGSTTCLANRDFIRHYIDAYDKFITDQDPYMLAWDSPSWMWLRYPEADYKCYSPNHWHPPGDASYYVWRNLSTLFKELHRRHPRLAMRVAAGLQPGYPWILKDLIEHHTGFNDAEPGGSWWESCNYRYIPVYKCTTTMSAGNWQDLKYNFFRSLSISDHAMLWAIDACGNKPGIPKDKEQRRFFKKWMDWANGNVDYLRVRRDLFREPWGDEFINRAHVDMEGSFPCSDPQIHGSAHCIRDRGFIFLFNPAKMRRAAVIPINGWIGLSEGSRFQAREIFPSDGKTLGSYSRGMEMRVILPPQSAMLIELTPTTTAVKFSVPSLPNRIPIDKAFYKWEDIPWQEIMPRP